MGSESSSSRSSSSISDFFGNDSNLKSGSSPTSNFQHNDSNSMRNSTITKKIYPRHQSKQGQHGLQIYSQNLDSMENSWLYHLNDPNYYRLEDQDVYKYLKALNRMRSTLEGIKGIENIGNKWARIFQKELNQQRQQNNHASQKKLLTLLKNGKKELKPENLSQEGKFEFLKKITEYGDKQLFQEKFLPTSTQQIGEFIKNQRDEIIVEQEQNLTEEVQQQFQITNQLENQIYEKLKENLDAQQYDKVQIQMYFTSLQESILNNRFMRFFCQGVSTYGLIHTGVRIGQFNFEWNDESLIKPKIDIEDIIIALDLTDKQKGLFGKIWDNIIEIIIIKITKLRDWMQGTNTYMVLGLVKSIMEPYAEICVKWNMEKHYDPINCNCQLFSDAILDKADIQINNRTMGSKIMKYINQLKSGNQTDFTFGNITFKKRKELDNYIKCKDNQDNYIQTYNNTISENDLILLRAFATQFSKQGDESQLDEYYLQKYKLAK